MEADKIISEYPKGLLNWYGFTHCETILYITSQPTSVLDLFKERFTVVVLKAAVDTVSADFMETYRESFDYIFGVMELECLDAPVSVLAVWKTLLKPHGRMLLGTDNRLALKYFCGDRDPFSGRNFDGIEHYRRVSKTDFDYMSGRCYTREEIRELLNESGFNNHKFYSVLPNLNFPQLIYAEDYLPGEELSVRYIPLYRHLESVFLEEEFLYTDMIKHGMFHATANSYLVECSKDNTFEEIQHVTLSMDRGEDNAMATVIRGNGTVEKRILYEAQRDKLNQLVENTKELQAHGLNVVDVRIEGDACVMPFMNCETLVTYLRRTAKMNAKHFIEEMDKFRGVILQSSEPTPAQKPEIPGMGIILKKGYMDLVPLNCFNDQGTWLFFDQEFCEENYPANAIIYRAIEGVYQGETELENIVPRQYFWERYELLAQLDLWRQKEYQFIIGLRNLRQLRSFLEQYHRDGQILNTNRQRINYSALEYQQLFVDIFRNTEGKKIILFGSGNFAKEFLSRFGDEYPIYGIVDNNTEKWGTKLGDISIYSPDLLKRLSDENPRVIICIKNYIGTIHQLNSMGVKNYCVYDTNIKYKIRRSSEEAASGESEGIKLESKKYHVGYIAGVFDLFHIGHLNMFKRAKEQCDYLIVGVVSDEGVLRDKKRYPFVGIEERLELVRSCMYVDEVERIPLNFGDIRSTFNRCRFDCKFSGSDYEENPDWLADRAYLQKQGADLVFFPYTESTSSTKLKALIDQSLL